MTPEEIRPHLLALLDDFEAAPAPRRRYIPAGVVQRIPVWMDGKIIGHIKETPEDRGERGRHICVRLLRQALEDGSDPYVVAWLALSVGGGTQMDARIFQDNKKVKDGEAGREKKKGEDGELWNLVRPRLEKNRTLSWTKACDNVSKDADAAERFGVKDGRAVRNRTRQFYQAWKQNGKKSGT